MSEKKLLTFADKPKTMRDMRFVGGPKDSSTSIPSSTSQPSISSSPSNTSKAIEKKIQTDISPTKNFQKVPNSVTQNLDLFKGKSKQIWDFLWLKTRGAINPARSAKLSRAEIKAGAALGSFVTVDAAIEHLQIIGLLKVTQSIGSLKGNQYEVFTPEEIDLTYTSSTSISSRASISSLTQKVGILDIPESSISSRGQSVESKTTSTAPNTLIKTNTIDDEALGIIDRELGKVAKQITGKSFGKSDEQGLRDLAALLVAELESAATKTKSISSVPAFLTEHLRRRLQAEPIKGKSNLHIDTVGRAGDKVKPLPEADLLVQLEIYREKGIDESEKSAFAESDWKWLNRELNK